MGGGQASGATQEKVSTLDKMATLRDLKEIKEALDAGLVSQAEYDDVKRAYLRAKKEALVEYQMMELRAKEVHQKMEILAKQITLVEFQKRELIAKEEFLKRESEAKLRAFALESIVKHGSSIMSEEQKVGLVRDYAKKSGLNHLPAGATVQVEPPSKRQRLSSEERGAAPPQTVTPPRTPAAANQAPEPAPEAHRAPSPAAPPAAGTSTGGVVVKEEIFRYNKWRFIGYLEKNANIITEDWLHAALPLTKSKSKIDTMDKIRYLFDEAARRGYVHIFTDHAIGEYKRLCNSEMCNVAASYGHLDVLKWLRSQDPPCPWSDLTCSLAAANGHLHVLKWLRSQDPPCPWDVWACAEAAKKGRLDMLKFLRSQDPPCPWSEWTCAEAAMNGHLDVLKWLRSQDPPRPWGVNTCSVATIHGRLDLLKWLRSQDPPCPWDEKTCQGAAFNGHLDVLKWLIDNGCPYDVNSYVGRSAYEKLGLA